MSLFPEDDAPKRKTRHEIGQDLSDLSLTEIDDRVALLRAEIERLEQMRETVAVEMRRGDPRIAIGYISTRDNRVSFFVRDLHERTGREVGRSPVRQVWRRGSALKVTSWGRGRRT